MPSELHAWILMICFYGLVSFGTAFVQYTLFRDFYHSSDD